MSTDLNGLPSRRLRRKDIISLTELLPYILIGGISTLIDWATFSTLVSFFQVHYEIALVMGYGFGGIFHYLSNKFITFKSRTKKIGSQLSLYFLVGVSSLFMSMGALAILVSFFGIQKVIARVMTTGLMILPNYLMHKHISFSKKIFAQPET